MARERCADRPVVGGMPRRVVRTLVLAFAALLVCAAPALGAADADHDALPDKWETGQKKPDGLNLKKLGAKPQHKDVFVELDFAQGVARSNVSCAELDKVYKAFKDAPVSNPDGKDGVKIHLDIGKTCPSRKYDLGGSNSFSIDYHPPCASVPDVGNSATLKRPRVFHFGGLTDLCGSGTEGFTNGHIMVMNATFDFPHLFMHELGHNLGLDHPPEEGINHLSVMNGIMATSTTGNSDDVHYVADYQRFPIAALNEAALSEPAGLDAVNAADESQLHPFFVFWHCDDTDLNTPGPQPAIVNKWPADEDVDWDCGDPFFHLDIDPDPVVADINDDGDTTDQFAASPAEWPLLDYSAGGGIGP